MLLITVLICFSGVFAILYRKLRVNASLCPLVTISLAGITLYLFALCNRPGWGYFIFLSCGFTGFVILLWEAIKQKNINSWKALLHPVFVLWIALVAGQYFLNFYGVAESMWDSGDITKHWGLLPRLYMSTGEFVNISQKLHAPEYPPMISLIDYFFCRSFHDFSDNLLSVSTYIVALPFLLSMTTWIKWSYSFVARVLLFLSITFLPIYIFPQFLSSAYLSAYSAILCLSAMLLLLKCKNEGEKYSFLFLIFLFWSTKPFVSGLLKDNLQWLAILAIMCMHVWYFRLVKPQQYFFLGIILAFVVQIKPSIILFISLFCFFICIEYFIHICRKYHFPSKIILKKTLYIISIPLIMMGSYYSWNTYRQLQKISAGQTAIDKNPFPKIKNQLLGKNLSEQDCKLIQMFKTAWFSQGHYGGGWHKSTEFGGVCSKINGMLATVPNRALTIWCKLFLAFCLFLLTAVILCINKKWKYFKEIILMNFFLVLSLGVFYFGLFFFTYNFHQGIGWSYPRYTLPFMAIPYFNLLMLLRAIFEQKKITPCLVFCGCILFWGIFGYPLAIRLPAVPIVSTRPLLRAVFQQKGYASKDIYIIASHFDGFITNNIRYESCLIKNAPKCLMDISPYKASAKKRPDYIVCIAVVKNKTVTSPQAELFTALPKEAALTLLVLKQDEKEKDVFVVDKQFYTRNKENTVFEISPVSREKYLKWDGTHYIIQAAQ